MQRTGSQRLTVDNCCSLHPYLPDALIGQQMLHLLRLAEPDSLAATTLLDLQHWDMLVIGWYLSSLLSGVFSALFVCVLGAPMQRWLVFAYWRFEKTYLYMQNRLKQDPYVLLLLLF